MVTAVPMCVPLFVRKSIGIWDREGRYDELLAKIACCIRRDGDTPFAATRGRPRNPRVALVPTRGGFGGNRHVASCQWPRVGPSWNVPENRFVGEIARSYDQPGTGMFADGVLEATVDCLVELAEGGAAMESAIGTGRVVVPLAARGIHVVGMELSADMLAVLRAKSGASAIAAVEGDMVQPTLRESSRSCTWFSTRSRI